MAISRSSNYVIKMIYLSLSLPYPLLRPLFFFLRATTKSPRWLSLASQLLRTTCCGYRGEMMLNTQAGTLCSPPGQGRGRQAPQKMHGLWIVGWWIPSRKSGIIIRGRSTWRTGRNDRSPPHQPGADSAGVGVCSLATQYSVPKKSKLYLRGCPQGMDLVITHANRHLPASPLCLPELWDPLRSHWNEKPFPEG